MKKILLLIHLLCIIFFVLFTQNVAAISQPQPSKIMLQIQDKPLTIKRKESLKNMIHITKNNPLFNIWFFIMCGLLGLSLIFYVLTFPIFTLVALIGACLSLLLWLIMYYLSIIIFC